MNIKWKERLNTVFVIQVLGSIVLPVFSYYGIKAEDLTTWKAVGDLIIDAIENPYVVSLMILGIWNSFNNPTTKGLDDK